MVKIWWKTNQIHNPTNWNKACVIEDQKLACALKKYATYLWYFSNLWFSIIVLPMVKYLSLYCDPSLKLNINEDVIRPTFGLITSSLHRSTKWICERFPVFKKQFLKWDYLFGNPVKIPYSVLMNFDSMQYVAQNHEIKNICVRMFVCVLVLGLRT